MTHEEFIKRAGIAQKELDSLVAEYLGPEIRSVASVRPLPKLENQLQVKCRECGVMNVVKLEVKEC